MSAEIPHTRLRVRSCEVFQVRFTAVSPEPTEFLSAFRQSDETKIHCKHETINNTNNGLWPESLSQKKWKRLFPQLGNLQHLFLGNHLRHISVDSSGKDFTISGAHCATVLNSLSASCKKNIHIRPVSFFYQENPPVHFSAVELKPSSLQIRSLDYLFSKMTKWLAGTRFYSNKDVMVETKVH